MVELLPHQVSGVQWLAARNRAGLFDEAGLGKTYTAICAARQAGLRRILVLSPLIVLHNWRAEFAEMWPEARVQLVETGADVVAPSRFDVVVCTHGLLLKSRIFEQLAAERWDVVILDEAHQFRGPEAQRTIDFYGLPGAPAPAELDLELGRMVAPPAERKALVDSAERAWLLSGTPMPNHVGDLWTHLRGLWPELLRWDGRPEPATWQQFVERFCHVRQTRYGTKIVGNRQERLPELRQLLAGIMLRRLKKDHLKELPEIRFDLLTLRPQRMPWELQQVDARIRPSVLAAAKDALAELPEHEVDPALAWTALREHEDFARFRALSGKAKVEPVVELLGDELRRNEIGKVLVGAHHLDVIDGLEKGLREFGTVKITGSVSGSAREDVKQRFQNDPHVRVCVGQLGACGVGVTLTAASEVVMVEMSFTPGDNSQFADRVHRIGQRRGVRVRCIALANTADESVTKVLRQKTRMLRELL